MIPSHPAYDDHKLIAVRCERNANLNAIIAVHDDSRGPAIGGCRIHPYGAWDDALGDVLRLSRGMSYKTAIADIPYGGGKAVIIADPAREKTREMLEAMGAFVESLAGTYITSFDVGTTLDDVRTMGTATSFAAGYAKEGIDAAESTADGVFACLIVAAKHALGASDLGGVSVAIQGVGSVGRRLAQRLTEAGAKLIISDVDTARVEQVASELNCAIEVPENIHRVKADLFSPNALGGIIDDRTIGEMAAKAVVGGANNQLRRIDHDRALMKRGILYCPDYLANAGGIINLHYQLSEWNQPALRAHIDGLAHTFGEIIAESRQTDVPPGAIADAIARRRMIAAGRTR
jgi:leucine dehydrogenase